MQTANHIDHICIGMRFRRTLQDVLVRRGVDMASDMEEFSVTLSNKLQALKELMEEETIDVRWQRVKGVVTSTYE